MYLLLFILNTNSLESNIKATAFVRILQFPRALQSVLMENSFLSASQIGKFQDAFTKHDPTGEGSVDTAQLRQVLRRGRAAGHGQ